MPKSSATEIRGFADRRQARDHRGGFTLVEMVLALAVLGLLASLGLPFSRPNAGMTVLRAKAFQIVALLRDDRNHALRSGATTTVIVDPQAGFIRSTASKATIFVPPSLSLRMTASRGDGFRFHENGQASGGVLSLSSGQRSILIEVNRRTAAVSVLEVAP